MPYSQPEDARPRGLPVAVLLALCACSGQKTDAADSSATGKQPVSVSDRSDSAVDRSQGANSALEGIGYSGAYVEGGEITGAVIHDADHIEPGLTLLCSGHDTSVVLLSAEGDVVHNWHLIFDEVFPDPLHFERNEVHSSFVRRAWPFPNGDLLAIFEYTGITRVDVNGKPLWSLANQSHHDFKILGDGTIVTLDLVLRDKDWMRKQYASKRFREGFADSHVLFLSPEGELLRKISILEAIHRSRFFGLLNSFPNHTHDVLHANSVDVLDATHAEAFPSFEEGDILVSLRNASTLVVIDGESEEVKWVSSGLSTLQHQASFLPTGSILLLDNTGGNQKRPLRSDRSRVLEIAAETQEILWQYPPVGRNNPFFTKRLGYVERLPGGNTLITESMQGRVLEVSPKGKLLWEYLSPYRDGENDKLITTLMGARRIPRAALPFLDE